MTVSDRLKYVYVAVPRTGSQTLTRALVSAAHGRCVQPYHGWRGAASFPSDWCRFVVVRHPVARMLSWWWFSCAMRPGLEGVTFGRYVEMVARWRADGANYEVPELYMPQHQWQDRIGADFVLQYEQMPGALAVLPFDTDAVARYWSGNKSHETPHTRGVRDRLTRSEWDAVVDLERDDFERYGYQQEY